MRLTHRGFSLLELAIATVILVVSILASVSAFLGSAALNNASRNLTIASNDAQYVLEQFQGLDYTTCIEKSSGSCSYVIPTFDHIPPLGNSPPNETISVNVVPIEIGKMSKVTVTVSWQENLLPRSFSLATYIANSKIEDEEE